MHLCVNASKLIKFYRSTTCIKNQDAYVFVCRFRKSKIISSRFICSWSRSANGIFFHIKWIHINALRTIKERTTNRKQNTSYVDFQSNDSNQRNNILTFYFVVCVSVKIFFASISVYIFTIWWKSLVYTYTHINCCIFSDWKYMLHSLLCARFLWHTKYASKML